MTNNTNNHTKADIARLLARFADGLTSIDEEEQLAQYFRQADDIPDEWKAYRDMFGYFDADMPIGTLPQFDGSADKPAPRRRHLRAIVWGCMATAAAAAALFVSVGLRAPQQSVPTVAGIYAHNDSTADSAPSDSAQMGTQPKHHRATMRHRYYMAPPKVYYAATPSAIKQSAPIAADSTATAPTKISAADKLQLLAEQHKIQDDDKQVMKDIEESLRMVDELHNTLLANGDYEEEDIY